jgi:8-oxo-dGTP diphosphatase
MVDRLSREQQDLRSVPLALPLATVGPVSTEPLSCAGALIVDDEGRIFVQRRSADRTLFPDCWDIVGGHAEPGETIDEALRREVAEETGWSVSHVLGVVGEYRYTGDDGVDRVETDFLVRVDGDLRRPRLETDRHTEFRWLAEDEIAVLDEHRDIDGGLARRIAEDGFAALRRTGR